MSEKNGNAPQGVDTPEKMPTPAEIIPDPLGLAAYLLSDAVGAVRKKALETPDELTTADLIGIAQACAEYANVCAQFESLRLYINANPEASGNKRPGLFVPTVS